MARTKRMVTDKGGLRKPRGSRVAVKKTAITTRKKVLLAAEAASEKKAEDIIILDMRKVSDFTDFFLICSAVNPRQAAAIADNIQEKLHTKGLRLRHIEGVREGSWVLVDYGDAIFHIFLRDTRDFYRLEDLWGDAPRIEHKY